MSDYRVYFINQQGHVVRRHDLACEDDGEAMEQARQLLDGFDIEVWQRARVVGKIKKD